MCGPLAQVARDAPELHLAILICQMFCTLLVHYLVGFLCLSLDLRALVRMMMGISAPKSASMRIVALCEMSGCFHSSVGQRMGRLSDIGRC